MPEMLTKERTLRNYLAMATGRLQNYLLGTIQNGLDLFSTRPLLSTSSKPDLRILFVCYGGICRSPMAVGIFRQMLSQSGLLGVISVDYAATSAYNLGKKPAWQARASTRRRGINISHLRARVFEQQDFVRFDRILVMDKTNRLDVLQKARSEDDNKKAALLLDYDSELKGSEIPDPYHRPRDCFGLTYNLIERGCRGLLKDIKTQSERL